MNSAFRLHDVRVSRTDSRAAEDSALDILTILGSAAIAS